MFDINNVKTVPEAARKVATFLREKADSNLHGGCYVDAYEGTLHVNLVEGREDALGINPTEGVMFHVVKHSYADLDNARKNIRANDSVKAIEGLAISAKTNQLRLAIVNDSMHRISIPMNAVSDENMFTIDNCDKPVSLLGGTTEPLSISQTTGILAANVRTLNGAKWYPSGYGAPSLAAGIMFGPSTNRKYGWLTTTHGAALNMTAYYSPGNISDVQMGKVIYTNMTDSRCDFSIVERTNTNIGAMDYTTTGVVTNLFGGIPEEGDAVYQCGYTSGGHWGTCLSNNWIVNVSGYDKIEYIQTDIGGAGGDSGGPILWRYNSYQNSLVSLMSGANNQWTGGGRVSTYRDLYSFDICQF